MEGEKSRELMREKKSSSHTVILRHLEKLPGCTVFYVLLKSAVIELHPFTDCSSEPGRKPVRERGRVTVRQREDRREMKGKKQTN